MRRRLRLAVLTRVLAAAQRRLAPPHAATELRALSGAKARALQGALQRNVAPADAPALLRLVFHDAGTYSAADGSGGANASILLPEELERGENFRLDRVANIVHTVRNVVPHRAMPECRLLFTNAGL